jgi:hypothetical protein
VHEREAGAGDRAALLQLWYRLAGAGGGGSGDGVSPEVEGLPCLVADNRDRNGAAGSSRGRR